MSITTGQYVELSTGVKLHYASAGDPSAPLLLMLHGFPEFWFAWHDLIEPLSADMHVVVPDLRGFNLSDKPAAVDAYKPRHLIADVVALIDHFGGGKAVLAAHDWGGAIAWSVAVAYPGKLSRLIIANSPHAYKFWHGLVHDAGQQQASAYITWLRRPGSENALAENDFARFDSFFVGNSGVSWYTPQVRAAYHAAWGQPGAITGGLNYYRASPLYPPSVDGPGAAAMHLDPKDFKTSVPTLVIWGEKDTALPITLIEGLDEFVTDLKIVRLPQCSHWLLHEEPALIAEEIRQFIGQLPAATPHAA